MKRSMKIVSLCVSVVMLLNLCGCTITIGNPKDTGTTTTADTAATAKATAKKTAAKKTKAATAKAAAKPQHQHTYYEEIVEGNCKKQGYSVFTCSCGDSYKGDYENGDHQYKDYVCTVCGAIDKENAYEYLKVWLKKNGEASGQTIGLIDYSTDNLTYETRELAYHVDLGEAWMFIGMYTQGLSYTFFLYPSSCKYAMYKDGELRQEGTLPANDFTDKFPLPYSKIVVDNTEDYSERAEINDTAQLLACIAIEEMARLLKENNVGITIADLGFTSYKV